MLLNVHGDVVSAGKNTHTVAQRWLDNELRMASWMVIKCSKMDIEELRMASWIVIESSMMAS
jgi:hypothetical protein